MRVSEHHAEWLSLLETSGPFLSLPVVERVFPQGLDEHDPQVFARIKLAHEEWASDQGEANPQPAIHDQWIRFVLDEALEMPPDLLLDGGDASGRYEVEVPEHREVLSPTLVLSDPADDGAEPKVRLLIAVWPACQDLDGAPAESGWAASPMERMVVLCRELGQEQVPLGLVTNGERWTLVNAPRGETSGYASWYSSLWLDEPLTLRSFRSLLGARRFFGAPSDTLEAMLSESVAYQEEVTDQLGAQVRSAVEVLVQALDRADLDSGRELLADIDDDRLYEAAVTVMMRLVFLFSAEERGLLLLGNPTYDQYYAVSPLGAQLRAEADRVGLEVLERRQDAWSRLCATFRAVYAGVEHDELSLLAYGGSLFDPDRFPFLEGRRPGASWRDTPASPLPIDNRTVLHLLEALQILRMRGRRGAVEPRRSSFRALDVEQIGHVYEGLLDHKAVRVDTPYLGLAGAKGLKPEVRLDALEEARARGEDALISLLNEETGRSESAIRNALRKEGDFETMQRLTIACGNDEELASTVRPYHALLRADVWGYPVVYPADSLIVTAGLERRSTQTFYTPRALAEEIVMHALEPRVYEGPAEGEPREEWRLRSVQELLSLKICDPAMGSGAFLVGVCRYLSERIVEAWEEAEKEGGTITVEGLPSVGAAGEELVPRERDERLAIARRLVAERCIYGVDLNPFAVEMAKLSVWLVTMARDRPFGFLDHALRCGDSLLGITDLEQIRYFHPDPERGKELHRTLFDYTKEIEPALREALELRERIGKFSVVDIQDAEQKAEMSHQAESQLQAVRLVGDMIAAASISTAKEDHSALSKRLLALSEHIAGVLGEDEDTKDGAVLAEVEELLNAGNPPSRPPRRTFHWPVAFPEIFVREDGGFDAVVANPPFLGGQKLTGNLGEDYREYLVNHLAGGQRGSADLSAYFLLCFVAIAREGGIVGSLATNSIGQGVTQEVGLARLSASGTSIIRAVPSRPWPGTANLEVAELWLHKGDWNGDAHLDGRKVRRITPLLTVQGRVEGPPHHLMKNEDRSFQGTIVLGQGFVLTPEEATDLIRRDQRNREVLLPYLNGQDLSGRWDQSASRWVINFFDWPLSKAEEYPDCFDIVRRKVKPERDWNRRKARRERWWQYAERAAGLYDAIKDMDRVLVKANVSSTWAWVYVPNGQVFDATLIVFAIDTWGEYGLLQSFLHREWMWRYGTTLETRDRYNPTTCFETFPFPKATSGLAAIAEEFHQFRRSVRESRKESFTKIANRMDDPDGHDDDIERLRRLQVDLDRAVLQAYGWDDLEVSHTYREVRGKRRLALDQALATEILDRLLELNHQRHAEEVAAGGARSQSTAGSGDDADERMEDLPLFKE